MSGEPLDFSKSLKSWFLCSEKLGITGNTEKPDFPAEIEVFITRYF